MTWERQRAYDRDEGIEIGIQENKIANAKNFLKKSNLSPEMIADCCSLPLEQVLALKEEIAAEVNVNA